MRLLHRRPRRQRQEGGHHRGGVAGHPDRTGPRLRAEPERAAIQYARELTQTADADETRDALFEHFNDEQIVEITLVAAMANFTNRFNNGLEIQPEG